MIKGRGEEKSAITSTWNMSCSNTPNTIFFYLVSFAHQEKQPIPKPCSSQSIFRPLTHSHHPSFSLSLSNHQSPTIPLPTPWSISPLQPQTHSERTKSPTPPKKKNPPLTFPPSRLHFPINSKSPPLHLTPAKTLYSSTTFSKFQCWQRRRMEIKHPVRCLPALQWIRRGLLVWVGREGGGGERSGGGERARGQERSAMRVVEVERCEVEVESEGGGGKEMGSERGRRGRRVKVS